ncbi:MAG: hypothetical protein IPL19_03690 [Sandaracinaceae bacterium]|jgi:hypothetical protein|nr:hypothetical protein [Sandaracinaceae bacterium]MBK8407070.1 hypothetical protein [Sandaracinaceae bacterium]
MTAPHRLVVALTLMAALLSACGGEATEAAAPAASASPEGAAPEVAANSAAAEPEAAPAAEAAPEAAVPELPVPTPPASWRATMDELSVDGTTVRFVSSTCGAFPMMPVVQAVAASTASCTQRADTQLSVVFESGRVMAINTSGPDAACVRAGVLQASTNATCQFQFTFGN